MMVLTPQQQPRDYTSKKGCNLGVIVKYLELLLREQNFSKVFENGPIRHKQSFLNYLRWLMEHGFVVIRKDHHVKIYKGEIRRSKKKSNGYSHSFYQTTIKGIKFLELVS